MAIATKLISYDVSFDEFLRFDDGNELNEYELVDGRLVLMPEPTELHEAIIAFLDIELSLLFRLQNLRYTTRKRTALEIKPGFGRRPDLAVTDSPKTLSDNFCGIRTTPHLIVEVASSNWSTDLVEKQEEYQALGVSEYWIVDYRGQIPAKYCLRGKGKKVIVLTLNDDGEYVQSEYLDNEVVPCRICPELMVTVNQILNASN